MASLKLVVDGGVVSFTEVQLMLAVRRCWAVLSNGLGMALLMMPQLLALPCTFELTYLRQRLLSMAVVVVVLVGGCRQFWGRVFGSGGGRRGQTPRVYLAAVRGVVDVECGAVLCSRGAAHTHAADECGVPSCSGGWPPDAAPCWI